MRVSNRTMATARSPRLYGRAASRRPLSDDGAATCRLAAAVALFLIAHLAQPSFHPGAFERVPLAVHPGANVFRLAAQTGAAFAHLRAVARLAATLVARFGCGFPGIARPPLRLRR